MNKHWMMAAALGMLTSLLYVNQYFGISVFVMTLLYVGAVYHYKRSAKVVIGGRFYVMAGYMALLSPVFAVTTVAVVRFFAGVILVVMLLALPICEQRFRWPKWAGASVDALFGSVGKALAFFTVGRSVSDGQKKTMGHILLGLIIAVPILSVAAALLASADDIMADVLENAFGQIELGDMSDWLWRIVIALGVAAVTFGYSLWLAREKAEQTAREAGSATVIPAAVSGTVLLLLNVLYITFAYIQIRFLFFGAIPMEGYEYAEYARSGFFELLALSMLNTAGILIINGFTKPHRFNHISLTVTAACTFVMIASSWYKMYLYEQAYGYTQLRLYVYLILAFMVVFMALITLGIWRGDYPVVEWAMVIGLCYFLIVGYVNVDAIIVHNNLARYEVSGELDLDYLITGLSEDGVPAVVAAVEAAPDMLEDLEDSDFYMEGLERAYKLMKAKVVTRHEERQFFEFNLRHEQALRASQK